jgi:hypothetical protein
MDESGLLQALVTLPQEKSPDTHWIGGWVSSRISLSFVERRKNLDPAGKETPAVHPLARCYTD